MRLTHTYVAANEDPSIVEVLWVIHPVDCTDLRLDLDKPITQHPIEIQRIVSFDEFDVLVWREQGKLVPTTKEINHEVNSNL